MRIIQVSQYGSYNELKLIETTVPALKDGQLLVRVLMTTVNPVDDTVRRGLIPGTQLPMILGNEGVGVVVEGNEAFPADTRVIISSFNRQGQIRGIRTDGTWQEFIALYPDELIPIPTGIADEEAAALFVGFFSAQACLNRAGFTSDKSVLSLGVGGAVGNAAVQLARAYGSNMVITTAGSTRKTAIAEAAGYENIINLENESIHAGVMRITGGRGVDIVVDSIGGALTGEAIHSLARNGIITNIGYSAGAKFTADITDFVWKGLQMKGVSLSGWFEREAQQAVLGQILPLLEKGSIRPLIAKVFDVDQVVDAQRYLIEEKPFGKVLLRW